MNQTDTIVALATPPGTGGIAVIRISGPRAKAIGERLHNRGAKANHSARQLVLGNVMVGDELIDQAMIVTMPGPHSYTGEDIVELQLHGSNAVVNRTIEAVTSVGARLAEPGEFTKRAYLNGKLDLVEAEAVADLIAATTETARKQAELKASGTVSEQIQELRRQIVALTAELSANLDFGEEDIPDTNTEKLATQLVTIRQGINRWLDGAKTAGIIKDGLRVAIIGLPNAGKSSLLNALVGYDRAIVTEIAGTTRDTLEEHTSIRGLGVNFVDTAGLRQTQDLVEGMGVERSQGASRAAQLILVAASNDQDMGKLARQFEELNLGEGINVIGVQTKIDLHDEPIRWPMTIAASVRTSVKKGEGLDELQRVIYEQGIGQSDLESAAITSGRQIASLRNCRDELDAASTALEAGAPGDVIAGELMLAAEALGGLLGESVGQEVINQIFSNFCIGK